MAEEAREEPLNTITFFKIIVMISYIGAEYGRGSARGLSQILEELTASKKLCNDKDALLQDQDALLQVHF